MLLCWVLEQLAGACCLVLLSHSGLRASTWIGRGRRNTAFTESNVHIYTLALAVWYTAWGSLALLSGKAYRRHTQTSTCATNQYGKNPSLPAASLARHEPPTWSSRGGGLLSPKVLLGMRSQLHPKVIEGTAVRAERTRMLAWAGRPRPHCRSGEAHEPLQSLPTAVWHSAGCKQATSGQPHSVQTEPQRQGHAGAAAPTLVWLRGQRCAEDTQGHVFVYDSARHDMPTTHPPTNSPPNQSTNSQRTEDQPKTLQTNPKTPQQHVPSLLNHALVLHSRGCVGYRKP